MSGLVVITRDLMDGSRFGASVPDAVVVRSAADPEVASARLIVLDLASGVDPAAAVAAGPPVVAYGAHVDTAALDAAVAAGCVEAVPRSRIFRRAAELVDWDAPVGSPTVPQRPSFDAVLARVSEVEGWMTDDQARRLYDRAAALGPHTRIVEIGSFRGRSLIVSALAAGDDVDIVSIDPHGGGDRGPQEIAPDQRRGDEDHAVYLANLTDAGVIDRVRHIRKMSDAALGDLDGEIDLLYIDGAHRRGPARDDIMRWGDRVGGGGTMLIHDAFSSIGVTLALVTSMLPSRRWRYVGRSGSMAEYRRENLSGPERLASGLRQTLQLPWFVRNVAVKVLLTLHLYPLTRLLGHRGRDWPY